MAESDPTKVVKQKIDAAVAESKKTGKQVTVDVPNINKAKPEGSWTRNMKRVDKDRFFKEGEGVESILDNAGEKGVDCGNFRLKEKNLIKPEKDEEEEQWEYKFEWDEKFAQYAQESIEKADGELLTAEEIDVFCLNILVAREKDGLADGVKVKEREGERGEQKRKKFFKKYK